MVFSSIFRRYCCSRAFGNVWIFYQWVSYVLVDTTIPKPISDSVMNVLITFVKNSGVVVATAMNVAAARSYNSMHKTRKEKAKSDKMCWFSQHWLSVDSALHSNQTHLCGQLAEGVCSVGHFTVQFRINRCNRKAGFVWSNRFSVWTSIQPSPYQIGSKFE